MSRPHRASWAAALVLALLATRALAAPEPLETAIKATYLYKFAPFVAWPETAFEAPSSAINLCLAQGDPFGAALDQAAAGQRVGERPLVVRRLPSIDRPAGCHILFVGPAGAQPVREVLAAVRGTPVLTITDSMHDPADKGIINFVIDSNRVRFEIDAGAAAQQGLAISSKLLSLAVAVRPGA